MTLTWCSKSEAVPQAPHQVDFLLATLLVKSSEQQLVANGVLLGLFPPWMTLQHSRGVREHINLRVFTRGLEEISNPLSLVLSLLIFKDVDVLVHIGVPSQVRAAGGLSSMR